MLRSALPLRKVAAGPLWLGGGALVARRALSFKFDDKNLPKGVMEGLKELQDELQKDKDPFSEDTREETTYTGPLYEFVRTRVALPHASSYKEVIPELISKREGHGKLIAAFSTEVGSIGDYLHIWAWHDLKERQFAVEFIERDKSTLEMRQEVAPWVTEERRTLFSSESKINFEFASVSQSELAEQGIYQLETVETNEMDSELEDEADWGDTLRSLRKSVGAFQVGSWASLVDDPSEDVVYNLWRFDNLNDYDQYLLELARFGFSAKKDIFPSDEILIPTLYSPLQ
jgi:hypothetical protein